MKLSLVIRDLREQKVEFFHKVFPLINNFCVQGISAKRIKPKGVELVFEKNEAEKVVGHKNRRAGYVPYQLGNKQ